MDKFTTRREFSDTFAIEKKMKVSELKEDANPRVIVSDLN